MDFVLATNTPAKVRDIFIDRGIAQLVDDGEGGQVFVGTKSGFKFTANGVPNPHPTSPLKMYLFRFVRETLADDDDTTDPDEDRFNRSKFVKWVRNNGIPVQVGLGDHLVYNEQTGQYEADPNKTETEVTAWRVDFDGARFWLVRDIERIAVWQ